MYLQCVLSTAAFNCEWGIIITDDWMVRFSGYFFLHLPAGITSMSAMLLIHRRPPDPRSFLNKKKVKLALAFGYRKEKETKTKKNAHRRVGIPEFVQLVSLLCPFAEPHDP